LGCTVAELCERMSSAEFTEWVVVYHEDPFGELRADRRNAQLAALLYNAHRGRNSPALGERDFMLYHPFEGRVQESDEAVSARLLHWAQAHNTSIGANRHGGTRRPAR
jgi:Protein of unknown function (DUF4035)